MSAHESMEQADQAKEASHENRNIALLIAVIALCLALSETLGKGAQTDSISKNVEASNLWAFFQAKSIRRTTVQTAAEQSKLGLGAAGDEATKAAVQKQIEPWLDLGITDALNLAHRGLYKELQQIPPGQTWRESFSIRPTGF